MHATRPRRPRPVHSHPKRICPNGYKWALGERQPQEWARRIDALDPRIQPAVACIVWWDFFSAATRADYATHLDHLIDKKQEDGHDAGVVNALVDLGYPKHVAEARLARSAKITAGRRGRPIGAYHQFV